MSELNLILLGPPGAGKGTQAGRLRESFSLPYIGTGDLLREHREQDTALGREAADYMQRGALVPDELVMGMIFDKVEAEGQDGFLLDGFPRNTEQADALASELERRGRRLTAVLLLEADDEEVVRRLSGRRVCENGHLWHVELQPPAQEGICDEDGTALRQRDDDRPETIRKRLVTYHEQTEPLSEYYEERGALRRFDASGSPGEVHDHIRAALATLRLEERL